MYGHSSKDATCNCGKFESSAALRARESGIVRSELEVKGKEGRVYHHFRLSRLENGRFPKS